MDHTAARRDRLARLLPEEGVDAFLISNPVNVTYLTGFTGDSSTVVLSRDRVVLISDARYVGQIADECPELETHIRKPTTRIVEASADVLKKLDYRSVGFESAVVTVAEFDQLKELAATVAWKPGADRVENLRMVKDDDELERIRDAIAAAERAFTALVALLRPEDTEIELANALEANIRRAGAEAASFPPIVAAGERAALPHCPPTDKRVSASGLLLVDWGAVVRGYKSDLTRVLATRTKSSFTQSDAARLQEIHRVVRAAQEAAIQAARPGVEAKAVDAAARGVIADAGYGDYFNHGLGHGLGLQIHEAPWFRATSTDVLAEGMVFTVEPGIYLPGWGGVRIEDDVRVTADGCEVLTSTPRDLSLVRSH
jgi:Xaa-Pro aminopeptidase